MKMALREAERAFEMDEVPVGAIVVANKKVIAKAHNLTETLTDVTAHAEMQAITAAANSLGGKFLEDCTLYITLEPCIMCAGAIFWSRPYRIVFGAYDEKRGFLSSAFGKDILHPKTAMLGGVLEAECGALLKTYFQKKR